MRKFFSTKPRILHKNPSLFKEAFRQKLFPFGSSYIPKVQIQCVPNNIFITCTTTIPIAPKKEALKNIEEGTENNLAKAEEETLTLPMSHINTMSLKNSSFKVSSMTTGGIHHILFKLSAGTVGAKNAAKTTPKTASLLIDTMKTKLDMLFNPTASNQVTSTVSHQSPSNLVSTAANDDNDSTLNANKYVNPIIRLEFKGISSARPVLVQQIKKCGIKIMEIADVTGIPHNGCRPKKKRRI